MNVDNRTIKIVMVGDPGVGKSSIIVKFVQNIFFEKYEPTIEDAYRKRIEIENINYDVEILDTTGVEQFTAIRDLYIRCSDGIIIVFSITSRSSLNNLDNIYNQILDICGDIPIVFCANKCDLKKMTVISSARLDKISKKYDTVLFKTSAKFGENIDEVFIEILHKIIEKKRIMRKLKKRKKCVII